jgi:23S rRNA pseudouridine2605 synthase
MAEADRKEATDWRPEPHGARLFATYCIIGVSACFHFFCMRRNPPNEANRPIKTLERVFSKAGLGSRTDARSWIGGGRVRVNGQVIRNPDHWVDLGRDRVTLDGKPLRAPAKSYVALYKPKGYITSYGDPLGRPTVYDLVGDAGTWLSPVGRLDLDTSGLLLLTNDTEFAERITNPEHKVPKTYQLKAATLLTEEQIEQLRQGVTLSDGPTRPAAVTRLRDGARHTFLEITISEGRNRQVRRMIEAVGSKVLKLVRIAIGPVRLSDLPIGTWRALTDEEIRALGGRPAPSANKSGSAPRARTKSRGDNKGRRSKS